MHLFNSEKDKLVQNFIQRVSIHQILIRSISIELVRLQVFSKNITIQS